MKRQLILSMLALTGAATLATAQQSKVEVQDFSIDNLNKTEQANRPNSLVVGTSTSVGELTNYGTQLKQGNGSADFFVNGEKLITQTGITGENPNAMQVGIGFGLGDVTDITGGHYLSFTAKATGIMYVFHKATANKGYGVISGATTAGKFAGYQTGFWNNVVNKDLLSSNQYVNTSYDWKANASNKDEGGKIQVLHCNYKQYTPLDQQSNAEHKAYRMIAGDSKDRCMPTYGAEEVAGTMQAKPGPTYVNCYEQEGYLKSDNSAWVPYKTAYIFYNKSTTSVPAEGTKDVQTAQMETVENPKDQTEGPVTTNTKPVYRRGPITYKAGDATSALAPSGASNDDKGENKKYQQIEITLTIKDAVVGTGSAEAPETPAVTVKVKESTGFYTTAPATDNLRGTLKNTADLLAMFEETGEEGAKTWTLKATADKGTDIFRETKQNVTNPGQPAGSLSPSELAEWLANNPVVTKEEWSSLFGITLSGNDTKPTKEQLLAAKDADGNNWLGHGVDQVKVPLQLFTNQEDGTGEPVMSASLPTAPTTKAASACMRFRVVKNNTYKFSAQGSKMSYQGYIFVPEGVAADMCVIAEDCLLYRDKISTKGYIENMTDGEVTAYATKAGVTTLGGKEWFSDYDMNVLVTRGDETADKGVFLKADGSGELPEGSGSSADDQGGQQGAEKALKTVRELQQADPQAPIYNLQGQRVGKGYKGVAIQNGKKFLVK